MRRALALGLITAAWLCAGAEGRAATTRPLAWWQQRADEALVREWSGADRAPSLPARPRVGVKADASVNAAVHGGQPNGPLEIVIYQGLLDTVIEDDVDALAGVIGHELAHVLLGHYRTAARATRAAQERQDRVIGLTLSREDELRCDLLGMRLAARAGYDPNGLVRAFARARERVGDRGYWGSLAGDHPTFTERLAAIDTEQAELWQAALSFDVGVDLLGAGSYACATDCFHGALKQFPHSPQVLCNLGFALLMDYYRQLPPDYWRAHDIGQPVPVGYADFLPVPPRQSRSPDQLDALRRIWQEGMGYLSQARQVEPKYALALGNIGFGWLVAPDGPCPDKAREALAAIAPGSGPADIRWAISNDSALAARLAGHSDEARSLLRTIGAASAGATAPAVNLAGLLADSADPADRRKAIQQLEGLLPHLPALSAQWQYAYEKYSALCGELSATPLSLARLSPSGPRRTEAHLERGDARAFLGSTMQGLAHALGNPDAVIPVASLPQMPGDGASPPAITCWRYAATGLELTFFHGILVRAKLSAASDPAKWHAAISAEGKLLGAIRPGDPAVAVDRLLPPFDATVRLGDGRPYRYYAATHLAVLVEGGAVRSLALVGAGQ